MLDAQLVGIVLGRYLPVLRQVFDAGSICYGQVMVAQYDGITRGANSLHTWGRIGTVSHDISRAKDGIHRFVLQNGIDSLESGKIRVDIGKDGQSHERQSK